jgi:site-specific DNA-methyltransferase (adenine-specific)
VAEADYPGWCVAWMAGARRLLRPSGSVLMVIREHVRGGQISDYVHRTRLAIREAGWCEVDELIWIKPDGPPVGHVGRPRRSWERILWFSPAPGPRCYPKADGRESRYIGRAGAKRSAVWLHGKSSGPRHGGIARSPDYVVVSTRHNPDGAWSHPATYPPPLAAWMIRLVTLPGDTVLDPFVGSGTTLLAALEIDRRGIGIGIDIRPEYLAVAEQRITAARPAMPLFPATA